MIKPQPEQEPLKTLTASIFTAKANHELILDTRSELGKPQASDTQRQQEARTAAVQTVRRFLIYPWPAGGARTRGIGAGEGGILRRRVLRTGGEGWSGREFVGGSEEEGSVLGSAPKNGTVEARERGFCWLDCEEEDSVAVSSPRRLSRSFFFLFFFQLFVRADCWERWV